MWAAQVGLMLAVCYPLSDKHLTSKGGGYNKFNVAAEAEAKIIVKDAIKHGFIIDIKFNGVGSQGQNSYNIIIETGKIIGTKGETGIKICFDDFGNVWTVYPYKTGGK